MRSNPILKRGLIVSCQALSHEPLHGGDAMQKMAIATVAAGAIAIRTNGADDIRNIKRAVDVPVIGLIKRDIEGSSVFITPTLDEVKAIIAAGADFVAMDVTDRENRIEEASRLTEYAHEQGVLVMADVSTFEEGVLAEKIGVDLIGTTLSGYTPYSSQQDEPDFELVKRLSQELNTPIIAEGRIWQFSDARKALENGAYAVVVGSAITRPQLIAARFVEEVNKAGIRMSSDG
ncbi:N-acylglucosamine-6-phosphate 2-epimerase [Paenibacillus castaneae]|uniref:N-acetylmannosamine-6-phosphate 2-epimerase n=1 Tax=Paenibacillus castaneae TaxID=474957 RepID=UPI000C9A4026|nr:N-acetylmannosamine-6-phosphate 2-epimerase [Paenibacillus castaneae]NIK75898.1 N-acylglucosamine-6-phosphate 2-epimerase [Paenibacillus castaneae]